MYSFCPHCGMTLEQEQRDGQLLVCIHCGKEIGVVATEKPAVVDKAEETIRTGAAVRCPVCAQLIALKGTARTLVPHYGAGKKICPGSGKPA